MAISIARALAHATSLLIKAGVNEVNSEKTARAIVTSDVWGNPNFIFGHFYKSAIKFDVPRPEKTNKLSWEKNV